MKNRFMVSLLGVLGADRRGAARGAWRGHGAGPEAGIRFARPLRCDAPALHSIPVHAITRVPQP